MANNYEQIMALVNAGNKMGLSNTITRDNGIPLDLSSVQASYNEAVKYAATKAIAYENQVLAAEGIVYIIVAESQGQVTIDDVVYENYLKPVGTIPGFDEANNDTIPQIKINADGKRTLEWVPISAIVEGDGNSVTTLVALDKSVTIADTAEEGFEGHKYTIKVNLSAEEGNALTLKDDGFFVAIPEVEVPEYSVTTEERAEGDTATTYHVTKDGANVGSAIVVPDAYNDAAIVARVEKVEEFFHTAEGETLDKALDTLIEIQKYIEEDGEVAKQVLANKTAIEVLNGDDEGSVNKKIADAISAENLAQYATKEEITNAGYAVASEVANTYATKTALQEVSTVAGNAAQKVETLEDKIDEIIADGGEPNVIEYIQVNGVAQSVTEKTVNITVPTQVADLTDGATLAATVASNTTLAQKGVDDAKAVADDLAELISGPVAKNTTDILALVGRVGTLETAKGDHETRIGTIEGKLNAHDGEYNALVQKVGTIEGQISTLEGEDSRLAGLISANNTEIAKKANAADVYTKDEVDAKVKEVADVVDAIDLTPYAKTEDVAKTYATITSVETVSGDLAKEVERAQAAEKKISDDLALLIENPTEALDSVKELIEHVKAHGTAVEGIITRLNGHDDLLAGIGGEGQPATVIAAIQNAVDNLEPLAIATSTKLGGVISAVDVDGKAVANAVYVNGENGAMSVKAISTDSLTNGVEELILDGGTSGVVNA